VTTKHLIQQPGKVEQLMDVVNAIRGLFPARRARAVVVTALCAGLAGCASEGHSSPELQVLKISTAIGMKNICQFGVSPAITVANAPPTTERYTIEMVNADVLFGGEWQETVPAQPGGIPEGAATTYMAPCLGEHQTYRYRIAVTALNAAGEPLAQGQTTIVVLPPGRTSQAERRSRGPIRYAPQPAAPVEVAPQTGVPTPPIIPPPPWSPTLVTPYAR